MKQVVVECKELQDYLDKYGDKIVNVIFVQSYCKYLGCGPNQFLLIIQD